MWRWCICLASVATNSWRSLLTGHSRSIQRDANGTHWDETAHNVRCNDVRSVATLGCFVVLFACFLFVLFGLVFVFVWFFCVVAIVLDRYQTVYGSMLSFDTPKEKAIQVSAQFV